MMSKYPTTHGMAVCESGTPFRMLLPGRRPPIPLFNPPRRIELYAWVDVVRPSDVQPRLIHRGKQSVKGCDESIVDASPYGRCIHELLPQGRVVGRPSLGGLMAFDCAQIVADAVADRSQHLPEFIPVPFGGRLDLCPDLLKCGIGLKNLALFFI